MGPDFDYGLLDLERVSSHNDYKSRTMLAEFGA